MPSTFPTPKKKKKRIPKEFRNNTKEFQTNYEDIWFFLSNLLFPVRNLEEFLEHMAYDLRYECSSRNFFVQICKIKGAANFYPRCDKLLANSPVRYFRLLRPCMHKCHHTKGQLISEWNFGAFKSPPKITKF